MGRRVSLLGKFSGLSLLAMVVIGLVMGVVLQNRIEGRALRDAEQLVQVLNSLAVAPNLAPEGSAAGALAGPAQGARPGAGAGRGRADPAQARPFFAADGRIGTSLEVYVPLRTLRCHDAQGFHLSRPLPPDALVAWLSDWRPATAQPA